MRTDTQASPQTTPMKDTLPAAPGPRQTAVNLFPVSFGLVIAGLLGATLNPARTDPERFGHMQETDPPNPPTSTLSDLVDLSLQTKPNQRKLLQEMSEHEGDSGEDVQEIPNPTPMPEPKLEPKERHHPRTRSASKGTPVQRQAAPGKVATSSKKPRKGR